MAHSDETRRKIGESERKTKGSRIRVIVQAIRDLVLPELGDTIFVGALSSNEEISRKLGCPIRTLRRYLKLALDPEERVTRTKALQSTGLSREERSRVAKERILLHGNPAARIPREQLTEYAKLGGQRYVELYGKPTPPSMTVQQRSESSRKAWEIIPPHLRIRHGALTKLTTEQRTEYGKKGWAKGLAKMTKEEQKASGKKAMLAQVKSRQPNGLEKLFIERLRLHGLYAESRDSTGVGQLYYSSNLFIRFPDGKHKVPDFKVKASRKIIELHGDWWHSRRFSVRYGMPTYNHDPAALVQIYRERGWDCRIYWEHEITDQTRLGEIMKEIVSWVNGG